MATKWKNIKYALLTKILCVLLGAALFALSGYSLASACRTLFFYGGTGALTGNNPAFAETSAFQDLYRENVKAVARMTTDTKAVKDKVKNAKNFVVSKTLDSYLEQRAKIIQAELLYMAESDYSGFNGDKTLLFDESRGDFKDHARLMMFEKIIPELEKAESVSASLIKADKNAPLNIYAAQLIVHNTKGLDYLKYADFVREEALANMSFYGDESATNIETGPDNYVFSFYPSIENLSYTKEEAADRLSKQYDLLSDNYMAQIRSEVNNAKVLLDKAVNFKYYIKNTKTGETFGNVESSGGLDDGKLSFALVNGTLPDNQKENAALFTGAKDYTVYFWLENTLKPGDAYYTFQRFYSGTLQPGVNREIIIGAAALLLAILVFVLLLSLTGRKAGVEGVSLSFIDKMPWDIHFLLSVGLAVGLTAILTVALFNLWSSGMYRYGFADKETLELVYSAWLPSVAAVAFAVIALLLFEPAASAARIIKSGSEWGKKFAVVRLTVWFFRCLVRLFRLIVKGFRAVWRVYTYKPKKLTWLVILFILLFALLNTAFVALCFASPVFVLFVIGLNAAAVYFTINYARNLDKIIAASAARSEYIPKGSLPPSLRTLADSMSYTNTELDRAIAKAVRDERMKTELITNVSHDLKTPLTSVITYIDLLKKLEPENPDAQKYIAVLEEKADKLKRLIDDLIEASKVSSGNIELTRVNLNLAELTAQAVAEASPDFEKSGLEIRFDEPEQVPIVFADSQKTYRILENLLSNARKYSAPGTRVYIRIGESDGFGVFEAKNISKEPLNITPEELTERFVRGDRSRSEEGNGLGLSIAKELAALQNGGLKITIDGDLFKVEVRLPSGE